MSADAHPALLAEDTRKLFCQLLPKLYFPDDADEWKLKNLSYLITQLEGVSDA